MTDPGELRRSADCETEPPPRDERAATGGRPTVDEMSEWSFPASDPPATWNWEPHGS